MAGTNLKPWPEQGDTTTTASAAVQHEVLVGSAGEQTGVGVQRPGVEPGEPLAHVAGQGRHHVGRRVVAPPGQVHRDRPFLQADLHPHPGGPHRIGAEAEWRAVGGVVDDAGPRLGAGLHRDAPRREVRRGRQRDGQRRHVDQAVEQAGRPRSGRHHHHGGAPRVPVGDHGRPVGLALDAPHRGVGADGGAPLAGHPVQGGHRSIGRDVAAVGRAHHAALGPDAGPALGRLRRGEPLEPAAMTRQRGNDVVEGGAGAVVDLTAQVEQRLPRLVLQPPPPPQRVEGQGRVAGVPVGDPEDAGVAVTGAVDVTGLELLHQPHIATVAGQLPGRGRTHGAPADDDHLVVEHRPRV